MKRAGGGNAGTMNGKIDSASTLAGSTDDCVNGVCISYITNI
jgi:hypothetical protein